MKMSKWTPESNQMALRRVGKTSEELADRVEEKTAMMIEWESLFKENE